MHIIIMKQYDIKRLVACVYSFKKAAWSQRGQLARVSHTGEGSHEIAIHGSESIRERVVDMERASVVTI